MEYSYYIIDPTGNITAIVETPTKRSEQRRIAAREGIYTTQEHVWLMNAKLQIFNQYSLSTAIYSSKLNKIIIMFDFENEKMLEYQWFLWNEYYSLSKTAENPR